MLTATEVRPVARVVRVVLRVGEGGELDPIEREVALTEDFAPFANHRLLLVVVEFAFAGVRATLVPDGAADRVIFPRREHRVVHAAAFVPIFSAVAGREELFADFDRFRNFVPTGVRNPAVDVRAAPVGVDEADRNVQLFVETNREVETASGAVFLDAVLADAPTVRREVLLFFGLNDVMRAVEANEAVIAVDFGFGAGEARLAPRVERLLHVRLAAADPNFADENVREGDFVFAFDDEVARFERRRLRREINFPSAVFSGGRFRGRSGESNGNLFAGVGPTPNADRFVALENGGVAEALRKGNVGAGRGRERRQRERGGEERKERFFH